MYDLTVMQNQDLSFALMYVHCAYMTMMLCFKHGEVPDDNVYLIALMTTIIVYSFNSTDMKKMLG